MRKNSPVVTEDGRALLRVRKVGGSRVVTLPSQWLDHYCMAGVEYIEMEQDGEVLVLKPAEELHATSRG